MNNDHRIKIINLILESFLTIYIRFKVNMRNNKLLTQ